MAEQGVAQAPRAAFHPTGLRYARFMSAAGWNFPWRKLSGALELTFLEEGATDWRVGSWTGLRRPGSISIVHPGELAVGTRVHAPGSFFNVEIDPDHFAGRSLPRRQVESRRARELAERLAVAVRESHGDLAIESALAALLEELARGLAEPRSTTNDDRRTATRLRDLLHQRYEEDLSLDDLAGAARVSRFHAVRAFRDSFGVPPFEYLVHLRLERASSALRAGERPSEVASAVGFADQAHLTRWFKRMFQVTPGSFRLATG
jgi:AraC-like DNA-binding protein